MKNFWELWSTSKKVSGLRHILTHLKLTLYIGSCDCIHETRHCKERNFNPLNHPSPELDMGTQGGGAHTGLCSNFLVYYIVRMQCFVCSVSIVHVSFCTHSTACEREKMWEMTMWLLKKFNNFVMVTDNQMPFGNFAWLWTGNKRLKFHLKILSNCEEVGKQLYRILFLLHTVQTLPAKLITTTTTTTTTTTVFSAITVTLRTQISVMCLCIQLISYSIYDWHLRYRWQMTVTLNHEYTTDIVDIRNITIR